ncbi:hypothetical protein BO94DRAFT_543431 [Aspergillus sclerotioniger CBS 115572]|uniref:Uncharacterized protein n=1 Tax=Aspergillus sclerotioniger CBS 115572 TaxID=1450535 RepID=A0A317X6D8_9EURO|nr:hypothetical protein BO94DRAFT_543431 [Aspergillus sclerotioniger CBS 115572]PWY94184.1 hypothetical protein BO94DRAFT_543431 [Aspergillus sclerotioniger CBS 115572]
MASDQSTKRPESIGIFRDAGLKAKHPLATRRVKRGDQAEGAFRQLYDGWMKISGGREKQAGHTWGGMPVMSVVLLRYEPTPVEGRGSIGFLLFFFFQFNSLFNLFLGCFGALVRSAGRGPSDMGGQGVGIHPYTPDEADMIRVSVGHPPRRLTRLIRNIASTNYSVSKRATIYDRRFHRASNWAVHLTPPCCPRYVATVPCKYPRYPHQAQRADEFWVVVQASTRDLTASVFDIWMDVDLHPPAVAMHVCLSVSFPKSQHPGDGGGGLAVRQANTRTPQLLPGIVGSGSFSRQTEWMAFF